MEENTQRDHGSKAQEWGSKESKKKGEMISLAPSGAIWAPFGRHNREAAPKGRPWAPFGRRGAQAVPVGAICAPILQQNSAFAKLGFLHPI